LYKIPHPERDIINSFQISRTWANYNPSLEMTPGIYLWDLIDTENYPASWIIVM